MIVFLYTKLSHNELVTRHVMFMDNVFRASNRDKWCSIKKLPKTRPRQHELWNEMRNCTNASTTCYFLQELFSIRITHLIHYGCNTSLDKWNIDSSTLIYARRTILCYIWRGALQFPVICFHMLCFANKQQKATIREETPMITSIQS